LYFDTNSSLIESSTDKSEEAVVPEESCVSSATSPVIFERNDGVLEVSGELVELDAVECLM